MSKTRSRRARGYASCRVAHCAACRGRAVRWRARRARRPTAGGAGVEAAAQPARPARRAQSNLFRMPRVAADAFVRAMRGGRTTGR
ncbi:hypothetical protein EYA82_14940 [Burkholderia pseudomallei]|nr:hypothetical protein EYA82_14940 [Burkholderia pseudomallei]